MQWPHLLRDKWGNFSGGTVNIIQVGDIHLRVRPEIPEEWQLQRYRLLFAEIIDLCKKHDAVLFLSGDILDRNRPSLVELQLLIECLICVVDAGIDIWLISGNHEAIGQGMCTYDYLTDVFDNINLRGRGRISYSNLSTAVFAEERVQFYFLGHPALQSGITFEEGKKVHSAHILITHARPTVNQFIREEVDIEKLIEPFDICFASDIHEPLELHDGKLVYTNSPLNSTFEAKPDCGCLLIRANDGKVSWERIPLNLPNLVQITTTADDYREPPKDQHYYRVEVKGASSDLREITTDSPNVKLLKVPEIAETYVESEDAEEIRDTGLEEALIEYMQWLQFAEPKIQDMMEIYREP